MGKSQLKLAIGLPAYGGQVSAHHARMWLELGNVLGASSDRFQLIGFNYLDMNPIDRARNFLLADAMRRGADWLFMIDADTWIVGDQHEDAGFQLLRMISDAERREAAIVMAPVMARQVDPTKRTVMAYRVAGEANPSIDSVDGRGQGHTPITLADEKRGLVEVDAGATACMAIDLHQANNRGMAIFQFTPELSEDLFFCKTVREHGGKIFVDTRVRTAHLSRPAPIYSDVHNAV